MGLGMELLKYKYGAGSGQIPGLTERFASLVIVVLSGVEAITRPSQPDC